MSHFHDCINYIIEQKPSTKEELVVLSRKYFGQFSEQPPRISSLLTAYKEMRKDGTINEQPWLEPLLIKRAVRTISGVAPIHVMTAPLGCPANCTYCPNEPGMPKSYLSNQPGAMRAILNDFHPYQQMTMRLRALYQNGHHPEKIELIENGGTWTALPKRYRAWFIWQCYKAANDFEPLHNQPSTDFIPPQKAHLTVLNRLQNQPDHLQKEDLRLQDDDDQELLDLLFAEQTKNETAQHRIIGVTLETRPDWLPDEEIVHLRQMGCTKVELGVQSIDEEVLLFNNRGHKVQAVIDATTRLRDAGFKVAYHIMPAMYKSTPEKDLWMFEELWSNPGFKPDFLKVYPCVVVKEAPLYKLFEKGIYVPYDAETLLDVLMKIIQTVPRYCRVARFVRDIPSESIFGGNKITNLREVVEKACKDAGLQLNDIRAREVKGGVTSHDLAQNDLVFDTENGTEHFLSFDDEQDDKLYAFLRLRLPKTENELITKHFPELQGAALVREVHTYGKLAQLSSDDGTKKAQHKGLGRRLMEESERIAKEAGFNKMAVIAGIGTREYYKKLGYHLEGTYMVKGL